MLTPLIKYLNKIHPLSDEVTEELEKHFELFSVPRKHKIIRDGDTCNHHYYVVEGLVRLYHIKETEEISSLFIEEKYLFNVPNSFYTRTPGYMFAEAIEPTTLARIHYDQLERLYKKFPELNFVARVITENYFIKSEERLYLLRKQTAEERYVYFVHRYPTLAQRVPLKHIASYLGIKLETLSRIRAKLSR
jgi:CRP-like cAMP-binding protein